MKITNEDNMKMMLKYPDGYFDLAIVDPPYGILNKTKRGGDHKFNMEEYLNGIKNQIKIFLMNFFEFQKIKLFGVEITLDTYGVEVNTTNVILFGIKNSLNH